MCGKGHASASARPRRAQDGVPRGNGALPPRASSSLLSTPRRLAPTRAPPPSRPLSYPRVSPTANPARPDAYSVHTPPVMAIALGPRVRSAPCAFAFRHRWSWRGKTAANSLLEQDLGQAQDERKYLETPVPPLEGRLAPHSVNVLWLGVWSGEFTQNLNRQGFVAAHHRWCIAL